MQTVKIVLGILGLLVVLQTGLSFVRTRAWWVRMFDFPRVQIAFCSVLILVALGSTNIGPEQLQRWELWIFGLLGCSVLIQAARMLPYTRMWKVSVPPAPADIPRERRIRIIVSNVCMDNREIERWLAVVKGEDPDVVVAVEADDWWSDQLRQLQSSYPHQIHQPQDNTYGMVVCSRLPFRGTEIKRLIEPHVPSVFTQVQLPDRSSVRCVVLHPRPPRPDIQQDSDLRDAELVRAGKLVRELDGPVIVMGDLNDVAWSHTTHLFQRVARLLDPRIGRGRYSTFHADHRLLRYPLDHVFHSQHFDLVELKRLPHVGSDHFPILIELALREIHQDRPEPERSDTEDEREAEDAIQDARELQAEETPAERRQRETADS